MDKTCGKSLTYEFDLQFNLRKRKEFPFLKLKLYDIYLFVILYSIKIAYPIQDQR